MLALKEGECEPGASSLPPCLLLLMDGCNVVCVWCCAVNVQLSVEQAMVGLVSS